MKIRIGALSLFCVLGCQREAKQVPVTPAAPAVKTLNPHYHRVADHALVREVSKPTLANLDAAAYAADVMLWDSNATVTFPALTPEALRFGGLLGETKADASAIPATPEERAAPLQWKPALNYLLEHGFAATHDLADAYGRVTAEHFGFSGDLAAPAVEFADLILCARDSSAWVEVELKPWAKPVPSGLREAGAGFPVGYARLDPAKFTPALYALLRGDYSTRVLSESDLIDYGHQLAAYWYTSRNTDFIDLRGRGAWPDASVETNVKTELENQAFPQPLFALRGKPHGSPVYFVLSVPGMGTQKPAVDTTRVSTSVLSNGSGGKAVSDNVGEYLASIKNRETSLLAKYGKGSWEGWRKRLAPFHHDVSALMASQPPSVMSLRGQKNFLIFRRELDYLLADDLQKLPAEKNPPTEITQLRDSLASLGIDFLFVPIPTKQDVYPALVSAAGSKLPGGVAQPYFRKLLFDLAQRQVESVDLLTLFQEAAKAGNDSLYQRQDTHWTGPGLEIAAKALGERVMGYAWFGEAYPDEIHYTTRDTVFSQLGDLYDKLPPQGRAGFAPENLRGQQVFEPNSKPFVDHPEAPVLVLGDSYTGVFELTGCRHAGVTARLAVAISGPVDLIMGWGGGPEAPNKLRRGGPEALKGKRLVIWMMSARDLFAYPGGWGQAH